MFHVLRFLILWLILFILRVRLTLAGGRSVEITQKSPLWMMDFCRKENVLLVGPHNYLVVSSSRPIHIYLAECR